MGKKQLRKEGHKKKEQGTEKRKGDIVIKER